MQNTLKLNAIPAAVRNNANALLRLSIAFGTLDADDYAIFDVTATAVLVQRTPASLHDDYYLIRRGGNGLVVTRTAAARVIKLAAGATALGQVIGSLGGSGNLKQL